MNHTDIPDEIASTETLGRGVFSDKYARKARRGKVPRRVFLEHFGVVTVSVTRLSFMDHEQSITTGRDVASRSRRSFYGWAIVHAEHAMESDRDVVSSPQTDNQYHADICLPEEVKECRDEQIRHAQELADASTWRGPSESISEVVF